MIVSSALIIRGLARGVHVASTFSVFGTTVANIVLVPLIRRRPGSDARERIVRSLAQLARASLLVALATGAVWLLAEAAYIAGSHAMAAGVRVLIPVVRDTNFGRLLTIRVALLILAVAAFGGGQKKLPSLLAVAFAGAATALQAGLGHGAAMGGGEGSLLAATLVLHLVAAGLWLGGLVPLLVLIRVAPVEDARRIACRFSSLGSACVAILAVTAAVQGALLVGGTEGLTSTAYGGVVLAKIALFLLLVVVAAQNRFRLTPALAGPDALRARACLARNIMIEAAVGLCIIALAGVLLELPPGMDMVAGVMPR